MFSKCAGNRRKHCPPGKSDRKRLQSDCSSSEEEEPKTSRKDSEDAIRASEDEIQDLLVSENGGARAHKHHTTKQMLLKELTATFRDEEKKRPPINKQFAEMANKRWSKKLDQEEVSNLLARYDPPGNCVEISVPRVNPEIWQFLNAFKRKTDLRFANIQQALQKSSFATLKNAGTLIKISDLSAPTNRVDVVALLGHAASELSVLRREKLKPSLKPEFHALCSSTMSSQKLPIVKDLAKKNRDVKETHRLGNKVGSSKGHSRGYSRESWDFL